MKKGIIIGSIVAVCMLLMIPMVGAMQYSMTRSEHEKILEEILEDDNPWLKQLLIRLIMSLISRKISKIRENTPIFGISLQILWFLFTILYLVPQGIVS